jgi:putative dimethyl sulfoxide reductase chaperone
MTETPEAKVDHPVDEVGSALARATLFSALALGFRPPTEETLARLVSRDSASALAEAAAVLDTGSDAGLAASLASLAAAEEVSVIELSDCYQRLFGHTARGPVPPYETEYGTEALFQQPHEMGDLMGFYQAFGLALNAEEHERPDHVSCELEFLSFLALKEAYALEREEAAMLEETRKAVRLFLRDHVGRFAPAFTKRLAAEAGDGLYGLLSLLFQRLVGRECRRLGIAIGPENLTLRPADDQGVPMACGSGAGCPLVPGAVEPEEMDNE